MRRDQLTVDEIIVTMRHAQNAPYRNRLSGLIGVLWRARLPHQRGALADRGRSGGTAWVDSVRHGKNDRRRVVGMDAWGWTALGPLLSERLALAVGASSA